MKLSSSLALFPLALRLESTQGSLRGSNSLDHTQFIDQGISAAATHCASEFSIMRDHCKTALELCLSPLDTPPHTQHSGCLEQWLICTNKTLGLSHACLKNTRQLRHTTDSDEKDPPEQSHSDNEHSKPDYPAVAWVFSTLAVFSLLDILRRQVCCPQQEVEIHEQNGYARDSAVAFSPKADLAFSNGDSRKPRPSFPEYLQLDTVAEDAPNPTQEIDLITLDSYDEIMGQNRDKTQPVRIGYTDAQGQRKFFPHVLRYDSVKLIVATAFSKNRNPEYPATRLTFGPKDIFQERPYLETAYSQARLKRYSLDIPEGTHDADQIKLMDPNISEIELASEAHMA